MGIIGRSLLALSLAVMTIGSVCNAQTLRNMTTVQCPTGNINVYQPPPPPQPLPPLCKMMYKKNKQCGGVGPQCKSLDLYSYTRCLDAPYMLGCCPKGYSCQRKSPTNWKCRPVKKQIVPAMPGPCDIPANSSISKPFVIDYPKPGSPPDATITPRRWLVINAAVTWDQANAICQYYYGLQMASIHTLGEMWRLNNQCFAKLKNMCWVGAHDRRRRGLFTWSDGSAWDWAWFDQYGGTSALPTDRCVAMQDRFQTVGCDELYAPTCQVY